MVVTQMQRKYFFRKSNVNILSETFGTDLLYASLMAKQFFYEYFTKFSYRLRTC